ncbi:hypothetical protein NX014_21775 [Vibrio vulnificus]|nr:hypothetical protein [Vibrio vulnificus]MCR9967080.1 hypothetical protein [Vibrio antiquarius]MCG6298277.1 hypothetical protein [Vibrio vulnificus]MCU8150711.1 hypothetical protein [Vibrio vulnificus]MCU8269315.1 hypothetical protein [Vibrio vulnificus]MCU8300052.1 hypothetical protein [Vibrio vulnificus]
MVKVACGKLVYAAFTP